MNNLTMENKMDRDKIQLLNAKLIVVNAKIRYVEKKGNFTKDSGMRIDIDSLKKQQIEIKEKIQKQKVAQ